MIKEFQKITIIKLRKSSEKNLNSDLQWFSNSLGLFNERDKEKSCFRVFIALIKASRARREGLTSDEIALRSNISRATVIHHLNRLIESGLVIPHNTKYLLRSDNLEDLVDEIKKDMLRALEDIKSMAEDIDEELGLKKGSVRKVISD
ncbi:MAG TPA: winged helix-turn-helix domain-containing protein [Candidatus Nanoarchaeia archaeon]|nr:winged helix-turn-helix domain-containing protein [Candidatus Nanoarchaeia archaeon]